MSCGSRWKGLKLQDFAVAGIKNNQTKHHSDQFWLKKLLTRKNPNSTITKTPRQNLPTTRKLFPLKILNLDEP